MNQYKSHIMYEKSLVNAIICISNSAIKLLSKLKELDEI